MSLLRASAEKCAMFLPCRCNACKEQGDCMVRMGPAAKDVLNRITDRLKAEGPSIVGTTDLPEMSEVRGRKSEHRTCGIGT